MWCQTALPQWDKELHHATFSSPPNGGVYDAGPGRSAARSGRGTAGTCAWSRQWSGHRGAAVQVTGTQPRCASRVLARYEEIRRVATHLASQDQCAATIPPGSKQRATCGASEHRHRGASGSASALGVASTKQGNDRDQRPGQRHVADASRRRRAQHGDREQHTPHRAPEYRHRGRPGSGQGHGHRTAYRPRDRHRRRPADVAHPDARARRRDRQRGVDRRGQRRARSPKQPVTGRAPTAR